MRRLLALSVLLFTLLLLPSCPPPPDGTDAPHDMAEIHVDHTSALGLCCWQQTGEPRQPSLRLELSQTTCQPQERQVRRRQCDAVCCVTPGGVALETLTGLCQARGGWPGACPTPADCCDTGDDLQLWPRGACAPERIRPVLDCDLVCCKLGQDLGWVRAGRCATEGKWLEPGWCYGDTATSS